MKNLLKLFTLVLTFGFASQAMADVNWTDYSDKAATQAKSSGKTVILGFHKKGCGTCAAQDKILEEAGVNKHKNVVALRVERKNSEHEPVYEKYGFNKRQWAAAVILKDGKEIARLDPGTTDATKIKAFLAKAM